MYDLSDLVSSVSSDSFSSDKVLTKDSHKALYKCISAYEESKGEDFVKFRDFTKDVYTYKEFVEKNKKYESIPKASKIYIYQYKNTDALTVIIHKDGNKIHLVDYTLSGEYKTDKSYYISAMCLSLGIGHPIIKTFLSKVEGLDLPSSEKDEEETVSEGANFDATKEMVAPLKDGLLAIGKVNKLIRQKQYAEARRCVDKALKSIDTAKSNIRTIRAEDIKAHTSAIGNALGLLMNIGTFLVIWKPSFKNDVLKPSKFSIVRRKIRKTVAALATVSSVVSDIKQLREEAKQQKDNDEKKINLYMAKLLKFLTSIEASIRLMNDSIDIEEEVDKIMSEMDSKENKKLEGLENGNS